MLENCAKFSESDVISWVRCKVSSLCFENSLMTIRGTRAIRLSSNDFVSDDFKFDMLKCRINNLCVRLAVLGYVDYTVN